MTKSEFNELFNLLCYGHEAELSIEESRYFLQWCTNGITIYKIIGDLGHEVAKIEGENKHQIVSSLFDFCFINRESINNSYQKITIVDIE